MTNIASKIGNGILLFFVFWTAIFFLPVVVFFAGIVAGMSKKLSQI